MKQLRDFVLNFCQEMGAIVEPPAYGVSQVLLPEEVARRLQIDAYQRFAFEDVPVAEDGPQEPVTVLYYGHPLVERILAEIRRRPACTRLVATGIRLEKRGLAEAARLALACPNAHLAAIAHEAETAAMGHYVRFNFKASLTTDEKHEQIVSVLMHVQGGYAIDDDARLERAAGLQVEIPPDLARLPVCPLGWSPSGRGAARTDVNLLPATADGLLSNTVLAGLLERAQAAASHSLAMPHEALARRAARHQELDRARLEQYYDDLRRDLERRIARADDERRAGLLEKLEAVEMERGRMLLDVDAKYTLHLTLQLINASVILQPKVVLPVQLENRYATISRLAVWDPLLHRIEPWACDVCGLPSPRLYLCTGGHRAHKECLAPQCVDCRRVYCHLCSDDTDSCVVCRQPVCRRSINRCDVCGRGTCREHRGLCHADDGRPVLLTPVTAQPGPQPAAAPVVSAQPETTPARPEKKPKGRRSGTPAPTKPAPPAHGRSHRVGTIGQRIEVYAEAGEPVISAVVASGGSELAVRSWQLTPDGIGVQCRCEKQPWCASDRRLLRPSAPDGIEAQMQSEVDALRREYQVPANRVTYYYVVNRTPRPERRLVLRGRWKDQVSLAAARTNFERLVATR